MYWNYALAKGSTGGILVGFRMDNFEIISWQTFEYCALAIVKNVVDKWVWRLVTVYGSPYEESELDFLAELDGVLANWLGPTLIGGGGFNLVRTQQEKSNGAINFHQVNAFNDLINKWGLLEIKDPNRSFSWSNNKKLYYGEA
jgi:hypothetical protein